MGAPGSHAAKSQRIFVMSQSAARTAAAPPARGGGLKKSERRTGIMLLLPAIIAFGVIILYPFIRAVTLSFFEYTIETPEPIFTGFDNFVQVFSSPEILGSWLTTMIFVVGTTALTFVLGLTWALLMHQEFKGRTIVRSLSLWPWVLPSTVVAFIWGWVLNGRYGVLNAVLQGLGVIDQPVPWLTSNTGAMLAVILAKTWLSIPLFMSFFLAGLQSLNTDLLDAARVDGANNMEVLRDVVIPHLKPVIFVVMVLGAIGNLQQFDVIYALTSGGPVRATTVLSIEVYRKAFESWDIGLASAIGVLWIATVMPAAYFYLKALFKQGRVS